VRSDPEDPQLRELQSVRERMSLPPGRRGRSYSVRMLAFAHDQGKAPRLTWQRSKVDPSPQSRLAPPPPPPPPNTTSPLQSRTSRVSSLPQIYQLQPQNMDTNTPSHTRADYRITSDLRRGRVPGYIDLGMLYQAKSPAGEDGGWIHVLAWRPTHEGMQTTALG